MEMAMRALGPFWAGGRPKVKSRRKLEQRRPDFRAKNGAGHQLTAFQSPNAVLQERF